MPNPSRLRAAVFLDRDGTIVEEVDYLTRPEQLRLIPGAAAAIRRLNERGLAVVVVTNQSAIARGLLSEAGLAEIHDRLRTMLAAEGARLDAIYYCPHLPEKAAIGANRAAASALYRQTCDCRKPEPGLLLRAARELDLDPAVSAMIGDGARDLAAGAAAGCRTLILVRTGHGAAEATNLPETLATRVEICDDLASAVGFLDG